MSGSKPKPVRGSTPAPDHIMLSLNGDASTERAVTWRTSVEVEDGHVLYRRTDEGVPGQWQRVEATADIFESDIDISRMHWCRLHGLAPGAKYEYTCGCDANRAGPFAFTTPPEKIERFKFICIADQQKGEPFDRPDYSVFNGFMKDLLTKHPDTAFILTAGDNTDSGQHEQTWNGLFSGMTGFGESVPFMMALGNHDNRGFKDYSKGVGRYYSEPAAFFGNQFKGSYPDNGPEGWKTENYTFDYGDARFCVIGINGPEDVNQWLIDQCGASEAIWKLGTYHFPICYSGAECENYDAYPVMREGFECFDLVFSGHEHNFARSFPLKNEELFDHPSQGTIHYMLGNSHRNPPGTRSIPKVWHTAYFPMEEKTSAACIVEVEGSRLTLTSVLEDGRIVDHCVIDKAADVITPRALAPIYNRTRMVWKGAQLGTCQSNVPCEQKDGVWFAALAVLVGYIGGKVEKTPGKVRLEVFGEAVTFTEGSDIAEVEGDKPVKLPAPVYRGHAGQLYIPAAGCECFFMRWAYAPRNNFISFEVFSDQKQITEQP